MTQPDLYNELLLEISKSRSYLADKPEESPESALRALWYLAAGDPRAVERCLDDTLPSLSQESETRLRNFFREHLEGAPLAHLTGRQQFMGIEMLVGPEALIPRKETEILGTAALKILRIIVTELGQANVIDLCTGSGNLALALAFHEPGCSIFAADLSSEAVNLAQRNAIHLSLQNRVTFFVGDLFTPFDTEQFIDQTDLIVCNPPYITSQRVSEMPSEVSSFEPRLAFDGGPLGLSIVLKLISEAPKYLKHGGWLGFEVGLGQAKFIRQRLERNNEYGEIQTLSDKDGNERVLLARRN